LKLLHVTDLHLNKNWYDWVAAHALDYDATCISGDLLNLFGFDDVGNGAKSQIRWVRHWVANFPSKLFLRSGNHDYFPTLPKDGRRVAASQASDTWPWCWLQHIIPPFDLDISEVDGDGANGG